MTTASKIKETLASLKGVHSTIEFWAELTPYEEAKNIFTVNSHRLGAVIKSLEDRVREMEYEEPEYNGL